MSRISDILTRARDSLVDHDNERWSDERLLRLVDEAQKDIARHSKLLKGSYSFSVVEGQHTYDLPEDIWLITRASFDGYEISLLSYDQMDEQGHKSSTVERRHGYSSNDNYGRVCWEVTTGSNVEHLVYDNRNLQEIRVYPIPDDGVAESTYTFQNSGYLDPTIYEVDSPYGVLTGVPATDELIEELGVTTDADSIVYLITDPDSCNGLSLVDSVTFDTPYGLVAEIEDTVKTVAYNGDELLGELVGIDDYTIDSVFGFTVALYDPAVKTENFDSSYGLVTAMAESSKAVQLWYIRLPGEIPASLAEIDTQNYELALPRMFDTALRMYVVGNAFLDDNDAAYRQKGQEFLAMYARELNLAQTTSNADGVRSPSNYRTAYRGPFE